MAGRQKRCGHLWRKTKIKERRERKPHATPLVCDGRSAQTTAHLAGKYSLFNGLFTIVEAQAVCAFGYSDIMLVKDGGPLHWSAMQSLASQTMAYFCVHRVGTHFNLNRFTKTAGPVFDPKAGIFDRPIFWSEFCFHLSFTVWPSDQAIEGTCRQSVHAPILRTWTMIWEG